MHRGWEKWWWDKRGNMSRGVGEGRVINSIRSLHPDKVALVLSNKFIQQLFHCCVSTVAIVDYNAVHILRQANWTMDLNLWEWK